MRILVTGSSGHLGEALVRTLRAGEHEVTGLDLLLGEAITYSQIGPGPQDIDYHACNIFEASMAAMNKGYRGYGSSAIKPLTTRPFSEVLR